MNSGFDNLNRLHDLARGQAAALRFEARVCFWRGARRWVARLIRRSPGYGVRSSTPTSGA